MRGAASALLVALATGCACGAASHRLDAGRLDVGLDAPTDVGLDADGLACWGTWCDLEGSRVSGSVRVDGAEAPVVHARVRTSYAFAVYFVVELLDSDRCPSVAGDVLHVQLTDSMATADPSLGPNEVDVWATGRLRGIGTLDVTAWEPHAPGASRRPGGRLAGHLSIDLPDVQLELDLDVVRCADESGP